MTLTGKNFVAGQLAGAGPTTFRAVDPATATELPTDFHEATPAEVNQAAEAADRAFATYRNTTPAERADFLDSIADEITALGEDLVERCTAETGLPAGRIRGERGRTSGQLKLFAQVLREGSWVDARIDPADPDRKPNPKPDVRSVQRPLGAVGVFGASNFPLAFSVAGGDTASALASGCPVVVKGHPSHPGTCELIAGAIDTAIKKHRLSSGVFSLLQGQGHEVGMAIVNHPAIKAIGFTGSFGGGKALFDAANRRPEPIPVYAEMGSTNPVFILPEALRERGEEIAAGLTASVNLGVGQFCTNPGIVFLSGEEPATEFQRTLSTQFTERESEVMLNRGIQRAFVEGTAQLGGAAGVATLAHGQENNAGYRGVAQLFGARAEKFLQQDELEEEVFGPSTIVFTAAAKEELLAAARKLRGHLTASLFGTEADLDEYTELIDILDRKVGRLIVNNFPTGVEVGYAMVHGGPFPATTDSRSTSVGTAAIRRFTRPVCYQNFPQRLLPAALRDDNPLNIYRLVNGKLTR